MTKHTTAFQVVSIVYDMRPARPGQQYRPDDEAERAISCAGQAFSGSADPICQDACDSSVQSVTRKCTLRRRIDRYTLLPAELCSGASSSDAELLCALHLQGGKSLPKGRATKVSSDSAIKEMGSAEAGTGTEVPEVDELGLVPPPSNLPAPWAKRSVQPDEVSAPAESREPPKPHERAADRKQQDSQPYRKPVTEPQAVRPDQQLSANLDTTMDYILDGAMPVNAAAQHPSIAHQGHMQMDTSSIQNSDRSLIQASDTTCPL